ncbi:MAG: hypothetical protein IPI20_15940 [Rhodoferax sp.]|nr:hypothetical protein [Rhodoferax sp.]
MSGFDQTIGQSAEGIRPSSSAPTSVPSGYPNSKSLFFASSATLLLLMQNLRCCIDRLNPRLFHGVNDKGADARPHNWGIAHIFLNH